MPRIFRRRVRPGFARTGDVLESTLDRAADIAGLGVERVGDVVDNVRPTIARALDNAELPGALRQAVDAGTRRISPGASSRRCRRPRLVIPAVLAAVAVAAIICLVVVRRRRDRSEPPPEGASA